MLLPLVVQSTTHHKYLVFYIKGEFGKHCVDWLIYCDTNILFIDKNKL